MKKKDYKIKITKNKILKENEYDFTGDFKSMGQALVDSAKMSYQTLKRLFKTTVFGVKTLNALRKKDQDAMDTLRRKFMIEDERMKQEQERLIQAQPGVKDLEKFLAMTSPGMLLFDKMLVNPNKREFIDNFKETFGIGDDDKDKDRRNKAAYHNFIMRIAEITHNAQVDLNTDESLKKKRLKKASTQVLKITNTPPFKQAIAYLSSFYTKTDYKIEDKLYFEITDELYQILVLIHNNNNKNKNKIIKLIGEKDISYTLNRITSSLKSGTNRARFKKAMKAFDYDGKLEDPETAMKKASAAAEAKEAQRLKNKDEDDQKESVSINITKDSIILNEEEKKQPKFDFKKDMQKSFLLHDLFTLFVYTQILNILFERNSILLEFKEKNLKDINDLKKISQESIKNLKDKSESIKIKTDAINKIIGDFNNKLEADVNLISSDSINNFNSSVTEMLKGSQDINSKYEELTKQVDDNSDKLKEICLSIVLSMIDPEDAESSLTNILNSKAFNQAYKEFMSSVKILQNRIDKSLLKECDNEIQKLNIPLDFYDNFENVVTNINNSRKTIQRCEKTFNNFTSNKEKIESTILELSEDEDETSSKESSDTQNFKYTETKFVDKDK